MRISIAIPTRNRPDCVENLIRNLSQQTRQADEVVVVDSSSDTRTRTVVEEARLHGGSPTRYFNHEPGLTRQRKRAIKEATGEVLIFLDDDVEVCPDFVSVLERSFIANPGVAGLGGFIENEWGRPLERWWTVRKWLGLLPGAYREGRLLPYGICLPLSTLQPFEGLKVTDWLPGGATGWRAEVFAEHEFSEFFADYGLAEDKEFSARVSRTRRLAICGDAKLKHLHRPGGRPRPFMMGFYHVRSFVYLLHSVFPAAGLLRHYQQLSYWLLDALLALTVGTYFGQARTKIPGALGLICGVAAHLLPMTPLTPKAVRNPGKTALLFPSQNSNAGNLQPRPEIR